MTDSSKAEQDFTQWFNECQKHSKTSNEAIYRSFSRDTQEAKPDSGHLQKRTWDEVIKVQTIKEVLHPPKGIIYWSKADEKLLIQRMGSHFRRGLKLRQWEAGISQEVGRPAGRKPGISSSTF